MIFNYKALVLSYKMNFLMDNKIKKISNKLFNLLILGQDQEHHHFYFNKVKKITLLALIQNKIFF